MKKLGSIALLAIWFTMGCKKQQETPGENEIFLEYKTFHPTQRSIAVGTTITFINKDNADHTATSTTKVFDSGKLRSGESFSYTFNTAGVFYFYCNYHSSSSQEQGAIVVQ
jgi:plastocyanin